MSFFREHKKVSITILLVLTIVLVLSITYSRYIYNVVNNYILETKGFYFNSSILSINNRSYSINNWDGVNNYVLTIDVNGKKNETVSTNADISYDISVTCSSNATCVLTKTSGIIYSSSKTDSFQLTVIPNGVLSENETVTVTTTATSTSPYRKELSATYIIGVLKSNFSYDIEDNVNDKYLVLNLTNSLNYYQVSEDFGSYHSGDTIAFDEYSSLNDSDKEKCFSAIVTLTIPIDKLALDMTANSYLHKIPGSEVVRQYRGYDYIYSYSFKVDATATEKVLFYKYVKSDNYAYPIPNDTSIIDISIVTAE